MLITGIYPPILFHLGQCLKGKLYNVISYHVNSITLTARFDCVRIALLGYFPDGRATLLVWVYHVNFQEVS